MKRIFKSFDLVLEFLKHKDSSVNIEKKLSAFHTKTVEKVKDVIHTLKEVNKEKESQYYLLEKLINAVDIGIYVFDEKGDTILINNYALHSFGCSQMKSIDQLPPDYHDFKTSVLHSTTKMSELIELDKNTHANSKMLSINLSTFKIEDSLVKLVAFQDIKSQVDTKEIEAWHKLVRTLGHEILNSVSPISSLAETGVMIIENGKTSQSLNKEKFDKLIELLKRINSRSSRLSEFISRYKLLTELPEPQLRKVDLLRIVQDVLSLFEMEFEKNSILLRKNIQVKQTVYSVDNKMVEQVLINIIKNAIEATENQLQRTIEVTLSNVGASFKIDISDNGKGIDEEQSPKIYVPFYTTKEGGSGIGLSLSKQIMMMHRGSLFFESCKEERKTTFSLIFNE